MLLDTRRHWIVLRMTAIAALPLCTWFVYSIVSLAGASYPDFIEWLRDPVNAILLIIFIVLTFYHAMLGVHEILEDYVHEPGLLKASMAAKCIAFVVVGAVCIYSVVKVAFLNG